MPSADMIVTLDMASMRNTPIGKKLKARQEKMQAANPMAAEQRQLQEKLEELTGLKEEDFVSFVMSMKMGDMDFEQDDPEKVLKDLSLAAAMETRKPLNKEKLKSAATLMMEQSGKSQGKVTAMEIEGRTVLKISDVKLDSQGAKMRPGSEKKTPEVSLFTGLSEDGKVVYLSFNRDSMEKMIKRVESGGIREVSSPLNKIAANLPEGSQFRMLFLAPDELRKSIQDQIAKTEKQAANKPQAGMMLGFVKPFRKLQSLGFGMKFSDRMDIAVVTDLGEAEQAQQVAGLLNGMVVPMLSGALQQKSKKAAVDVNEIVSVSAPDTTVRIDISMDEDLIDTATKMAPVPAMPGAGTPPRRQMKPQTGSGAAQPTTSSGSSDSVADLVGMSLEKVKDRLGRAKGQLEKGDGGVVWLYEDFEVHSRDGETVSSIRDLSGNKMVPVTSESSK